MAVFKGQKEKMMLDGPENLNRLVIGAEITGNLKTLTSVRLDGVVTGTIDCGAKLVLGTKGVVKGTVNAKQAEIEGTIDGDLFISELLILRATAKINGDISTKKLIIEDGAEFNGSCRMGEAEENRKPVKSEDEVLEEQREEDLVY